MHTHNISYNKPLAVLLSGIDTFYCIPGDLPVIAAANKQLRAIVTKHNSVYSTPDHKALCMSIAHEIGHIFMDPIPWDPAKLLICEANAWRFGEFLLRSMGWTDWAYYRAYAEVCLTTYKDREAAEANGGVWHPLNIRPSLGSITLKQINPNWAEVYR